MTEPLSPPYSPHGAALAAYAAGDKSAILIGHQDGGRDDIPAAFWFREEIGPTENLALAACVGRVLDLGAGTGLHALALQAKGLEVVALDIAPECIEIMRGRGVREPVVADLFTFDGGKFDTIVTLCNGLDKVGTLPNLDRFLARMAALLAPGGQLLADSFDLRVGADAERSRQIAARKAEGRYFGEIDMQLEFRGQRGEPFTVLQVDPETLARHAGAGGWRCEILMRDGGSYLARLTR